MINQELKEKYKKLNQKELNKQFIDGCKNDDLDIPVGYQNLKPLRLKYNQVCELLNVTRDCLRKIIENDPTFPRFLKEGASRQAAVYFDTEEIEEWYRNYKTKCRGER